MLKQLAIGIFGIAIGTTIGVGCTSLISLVKLPDEVTPAATVPSPIVVSNRLTLENFDRITIGATLPQVEEIIGKGELTYQSQSGSDRYENWHWKNGFGTIGLSFRNGVLHTKNQMNLQSSGSVTPIATIPPSPVPPSPSPTVIPSPIVPSPTPVSFESLAPCDQLDSIAKAGKSVAEFIAADWAKYGHVGNVCPWHREQIELADRLLNPPVVRPVTRVQPIEIQEPKIIRRPIVVERPVRRQRPRPIEGTCYMANSADCPREFNGNPFDNQQSSRRKPDNPDSIPLNQL